MDASDVIVYSFLLLFLASLVLNLHTAFTIGYNARFLCESQGLELIDYDAEFLVLTEVECGNKKPELQYNDYKVFTK